MNLQQGAWGGGNQFGHSLSKFLRQKGCKVFFDLKRSDLDIIMLTEPRIDLASSSYSDEDIIGYLKYRNPSAIVVHRINECDERKGTTGLNQVLIDANTCADHTVFISTWLRNLFSSLGIGVSNASVIRNGALTDIFNRYGYTKWKDPQKIKLVTHHWGGNWLKGFDIYKRLDKMLSEEKWKEQISFTYIGQLPDGFSFNNAKYMEPLSGVDLADELRRQLLYVTASRNEPAGMHHIEGALCGLPLLYIKSGALPEYCDGFGLAFTPNNFEESLEEMLALYTHWTEKMPLYPYTAEKMCEEYYSLFQELLDNREEIFLRRRPMFKPKLIQRILYQISEIIVEIKRLFLQKIRRHLRGE